MALDFTDSDVVVIKFTETALRSNRGYADTADEGRLQEAISAAADALFHVLNVANAYNVKQLSYEQLHGKPDPAKHDAEVQRLSDEWSVKS